MSAPTKTYRFKLENEVQFPAEGERAARRIAQHIQAQQERVVTNAVESSHTRYFRLSEVLEDGKEQTIRDRRVEGRAKSSLKRIQLFLTLVLALTLVYFGLADESWPAFMVGALYLVVIGQDYVEKLHND